MIPWQLIFFSIPSLIYIAVRKHRGADRQESFALLGWRKSSPGYYLWGLGIALLLSGAGWLGINLIPKDVLQNPNVSISAYSGWKPGLASFLLIWLREAIYVALGEEIFFRGLLGGWLVRRLGFWVGNTLQAAAFLLPHLLLLTVSAAFWPVILTQFLAGWLLGWLRIRSGSILPGWLAHSLSNAVGALAILIR